ncbi:MAG: hypothetical protein K8T20_04555 [Planctomycetes bacterium]|nr:hypothetical protein [Planctomycetota bacterium]
MRAFLVLAALAALQGVSFSDTGQIIWVTGQGEIPMEGEFPNTASAFREALKGSFPGWRIESRTLRSLRAPLPADAVLVMAGPVRDISTAEEASLRAILASDVRLLVCIDPVKDHPATELARLRAVLRESGVEVGADRLSDPDHERAKAEKSDGVVFAATFSRADHPLFTHLPTGSEILFSNACRVAAMAGSKDAWQIREIAATGTNAFGQNAAGGLSPAGPVAVAAERRGGTGRFVVIGDATFLTNNFAARNGVKDAPLALAAVKWLAEQPEKFPTSAPTDERDPSILITAIVGASVLVIGAAAFSRRN